LTTVIRAENLSKKYRLSHQTSGSYSTLRETVSRTASDAVKRIFGRTGADGVSKRTSEEFWALKDVSFDIRQGERVGIIGRNGAGKTTLLKILSRITEPTEGRVSLKGRVASLLEVGTGFHPELTGRENIFLNGAVLGMGRDEIRRRFDEIVSFAEIDKFLDTPVKRYSSGMYVRLAFAVAAHLEPEILLVDEVLAVGDALFQKKCLGKMDSVSREGRTVLFVSHNMGAVRNLCSRNIYLSDGSIKIDGLTDKVIQEYLTESVQEASSTIELPDLEVDGHGRGVRLSFRDPAGNGKTSFLIGERWNIILEFEMRQQTRNVIAAVGMANREMVPILTYWSKPKDLEVGMHRVAFEVKEPLGVNNIQFFVGLSASDSNFYYLPNVGDISIVDAAVGKQPHKSRTGAVLTTWQESEIEKIDEL